MSNHGITPNGLTPGAVEVRMVRQGKLSRKTAPQRRVIFSHGPNGTLPNTISY